MKLNFFIIFICLLIVGNLFNLISDKLTPNDKDSNQKLRFEDLVEYDTKGNAIHFKKWDGYEDWSDYDDKGNIIHYKDSKGEEYWRYYDDKGNEIHYKNSDGLEYWCEYDDKNNPIKTTEYRSYGDPLVHTFTYPEFDKKGNWITQYVWEDGEVINVVKREITYR